MLTLSIVTPSYNQAEFIQETIDSVLNQSYACMEYLIMDGGSKDLTVPILKTYGDSIQWVSEPDHGQADAVNKGIRKASGDIIGWINSDDVYYPGTFAAVMDVFEKNPDVNVLYGDADHIDRNGNYLEDYYTEEWNYERLKEICFICQPTVFFRRKTIEKNGYLDPKRQYSMDYDLWLRMGKTEHFYYLKRKLAGSRLYAENKTLGFVENVHLDIMDTLKENTGTVCDRWIEGSANSVVQSKQFSAGPDVLHYMQYVNQVIAHISEYADRYLENTNLDLKVLPYSYEHLSVGIDVSAAVCGNYGGVSEYVSALTNQLTELAPNCHYHLYYSFGKRIPSKHQDSVIKKRKNVEIHWNSFLSADMARYAFSSAPLEETAEILGRPNVVLCPGFEFSKKLSGFAATVYTLFDLSFLEHPEYTTPENYENCFSNVYEASLYADCFLAISEYTKGVFLKYFPHVDEKRIHVTYLGCREQSFSGSNHKKILSELGIGSKSFWLSVGTIEPRKNLKSLIEAYSLLKKDGDTFPLYIAGGKGWMNSDIYELVNQLGLEKDITFLGFVTEEQLNVLYSECYACVYPSYYEGFGLPVLEAMAAGAAVISSNTTSLPEVGGDAAVYIDPNSVDSIYQAMRSLQQEKGLCAELKRKGKEQAAKFSWKTTAEETYRCLFDAVNYHVNENR